MLYTRKGDKGNTYIFSCDQKMSKSSERAEALGAVDEINSLLGLLKVKSENFQFSIINSQLMNIIESIQQDLFIVQAILGGADKVLTAERVAHMEGIVDAIEKEMPPIHSFFLAGGTELSVLCDYARAVARRAERRVVALHEQDPLPAEVLRYLNRLSSLLYAVARWVNVKAGAGQKTPRY